MGLDEKYNDKYSNCAETLAILFLVGFVIWPWIKEAWNQTTDHLIRWMTGYEEVIQVGGVSLLFKEKEDMTGILHDIQDQSRELARLLGPPVYQGRILVDLHGKLRAQGGQLRTQTHFRPWRILELPNRKPSVHVIRHELVHAFYQSDSWLTCVPKQAAEGLAEAVTSELGREGIPYLIPEYYPYYLSGLSGLMGFYGHKSNTLALNNIFYSITALFFYQLNQQEPGLYTRLLNERPPKNVTWCEYLQIVVNHSSKPQEFIDMINGYHSLGLLSHAIYAIPVRLDSNPIPSVLLFIPSLSQIRQRTLPVTISDHNNENKNQMILFEQGVGQYFTNGLQVGNLRFRIHVDGVLMKTDIN
ncbi:hypothetical protein BVY01_00745 [bacterium I07]|nr:hypothetical protein BVY01_00745 [bacterium I07]